MRLYFAGVGQGVQGESNGKIPVAERIFVQRLELIRRVLRARQGISASSRSSRMGCSLNQATLPDLSTMTVATAVLASGRRGRISGRLRGSCRKGGRRRCAWLRGRPSSGGVDGDAEDDGVGGIELGKIGHEADVLVGAGGGEVERVEGEDDVGFSRESESLIFFLSWLSSSKSGAGWPMVTGMEAPWLRRRGEYSGEERQTSNADAERSFSVRRSAFGVVTMAG